MNEFTLPKRSKKVARVVRRLCANGVRLNSDGWARDFADNVRVLLESRNSAGSLPSYSGQSRNSRACWWCPFATTARSRTYTHLCVCVCVCVCVEQPEESVRNFTACRDHTIEESELRAITRTATLLSVFAGGLLASGFSSD